MFTVLSNVRKSNLYLLGALAIAVFTVLAIVASSSITVREPVLVPVSGNSEAGSDYHQRHPELREAGVTTSPLESPKTDTPGLACESPVDCR